MERIRNLVNGGGEGVGVVTTNRNTHNHMAIATYRIEYIVIKVHSFVTLREKKVGPAATVDPLLTTLIQLNLFYTFNDLGSFSFCSSSG